MLINADMAKKYGIDLSKIKTLVDYESVLKTVKEKSTAEGKKVIGLVGETGLLNNTLSVYL